MRTSTTQWASSMVVLPKIEAPVLAACAALTLWLCSCSSPHDTQQPPIKGEIKFKDPITGLQLEITNPQDEALCVPVPSLSAHSGSLKFFKSGVQQIPGEQRDYGSSMNGYGPFYIVSAHSRTTLPLDDSALKVDDGVYDIVLDMAWVRCRSIASDQKHDMNILSRATFPARVEYKTFR